MSDTPTPTIQSSLIDGMETVNVSTKGLVSKYMAKYPEEREWARLAELMFQDELGNAWTYMNDEAKAFMRMLAQKGADLERRFLELNAAEKSGSPLSA